MGASSVRVFGGGIAQGATETQAVEWAVEVYKPILDYAAAKGIVLGLEDDDDLTRTSAQLLTIVKQVNHPAARIALDCGNFRKDGYKECEICAPCVVDSCQTADVHAGRPTGAGGLGETIRHPRERRVSRVRLA